VRLSLELPGAGHATVLPDHWWDDIQLCGAPAGLSDVCSPAARHYGAPCPTAALS